MRKEIRLIYEEDDYSVFKALENNRDVLQPRVNKLIASMSNRYVLNPIMVNEKMEVIDGQGRFEARKALGLPIHYYVEPGATIEDCRRMNRYNTKWSLVDFVTSHAKSGNKNYVLALKTCERLNINLTKLFSITGKESRPRKDEEGIIQRGDLSFTENDALFAEKVETTAKEIVEALAYEKRLNPQFYRSISIILKFEGYQHERMLKNCALNRSTFVPMARIEDQLKEFERIYNYRSKNAKNKLYFSDYMRNRGSNVRDYSDKDYKNRHSNRDVSTLSK